MKLRKGDEVLVIAGEEKGKIGKIEKSLPHQKLVVVPKVNIQKKHQKRSAQSPQGGILDIEAPISVSSVMIICPHCKAVTRVAHKTLGNKKVRICKKCQGFL